jgi:hypothetical protein
MPHYRTVRSLLMAAIFAALVAATLVVAPAAAAQDPSKPIPPDDPACLAPEPPRVCLADDRRQYQGREVPSPWRVNIIVPASAGADGRALAENVCLLLPDATSTVTISRVPLIRATGADRPVMVTVRSLGSPGDVIGASLMARDPFVVTDRRLGGYPCFRFEIAVSAEETAGVEQPSSYFAQIVTIEAR